MRGLAVGDLNGDGRPDLAVAGGGDGVAILLNHGALVSVEGAAPPQVLFAAPRPSPARGSVTFDFSLPRAAPATLRIFDAAGREVHRVLEGSLAAGPQRARWDGLAAGNRPAPPGIYLARLEVAGVRLTRRVVLLR